MYLLLLLLLLPCLLLLFVAIHRHCTSSCATGDSDTRTECEVFHASVHERVWRTHWLYRLIHLAFRVLPLEPRPPYGMVRALCQARDQARMSWSYAVPSSSAIEAIGQCVVRNAIDSIIDIGAGTAYWTFLLATAMHRRATAAHDGTDGKDAWFGRMALYAFEIEQCAEHAFLPYGEHCFPASKPNSRIRTHFQVGDAIQLLQRIGDTSNSMLLLVWPPCWSEMATQAIGVFDGKCIAYVGEAITPARHWNATASQSLHRELLHNWHATAHVKLPHWYGCQDSLTIYQRNSSSSNNNRGKRQHKMQ
jgi:hypothetical protein